MNNDNCPVASHMGGANNNLTTILTCRSSLNSHHEETEINCNTTCLLDCVMVTYVIPSFEHCVDEKFCLAYRKLNTEVSVERLTESGRAIL